MGEYTAKTLNQGSPITKPAIRCLSRQGGVKRTPGITYEAMPWAVDT